MLLVASFQPSKSFRVFGVFRGSASPFLCLLVFFVAIPIRVIRVIRGQKSSHPICVNSRSFAVKI